MEGRENADREERLRDEEEAEGVEEEEEGEEDGDVEEAHESEDEEEQRRHLVDQLNWFRVIINHHNNNNDDVEDEDDDEGNEDYDELLDEDDFGETQPIIQDGDDDDDEESQSNVGQQNEGAYPQRTSRLIRTHRRFSSSERRPFDVNLPSSHSYLGEVPAVPSKGLCCSYTVSLQFGRHELIKPISTHNRERTRSSRHNRGRRRRVEGGAHPNGAHHLPRGCCSFSFINSSLSDCALQGGYHSLTLYTQSIPLHHYLNLYLGIHIHFLPPSSHSI